MIRNGPGKRPAGMTKHQYELRQAGIAKQNEIRRQAALSRRIDMQDIGPRKKLPVPMKRIIPFLVCVIVALFFLPSPDDSPLRKGKIENPLILDSIQHPEYPIGVVRYADGANNYVVFFQSGVSYKEIISGVYEDTLLISAKKVYTQRNAAPLIYQISAEGLSGIELFVNEENRPFDAVYYTSEGSEVLSREDW